MIKFFICFAVFFLLRYFIYPYGIHTNLVEWFTAARPIEQGFYGLLSRFIYKIIHLFTLFSFILIFIFLIKKLLMFLSDKKILHSSFNLLIFLWIPALYSYLLLGLILFYFLVKNLSTNKIIFIIILNFSTWFIQFDF